jgi:mannose-6-phosphate isomerase-like protein (cupin superfamily)
MPLAGDVLDLGPIGANFHVRKNADDTDGRSLEMEWFLEPRSSGTPIHIHPAASESYRILEGELDLYIGGKWRRLRAGQETTVEAGIPHTFKNPSDLVTRVYNTHAPAMKFGEYFESIHHVVKSGKVRSDRMSLRAVLYLSMIMTSFENEIQSVRPPQIVMRVMAAFARLLGYRLPNRHPDLSGRATS